MKHFLELLIPLDFPGAVMVTSSPSPQFQRLRILGPRFHFRLTQPARSVSSVISESDQAHHRLQPTVPPGTSIGTGSAPVTCRHANRSHSKDRSTSIPAVPAPVPRVAPAQMPVDVLETCPARCRAACHVADQPPRDGLRQAASRAADLYTAPRSRIAVSLRERLALDFRRPPPLLFARQVRQIRQRLAICRIPFARQLRQQFVPDSIPREPAIAVGRVLPPRDARVSKNSSTSARLTSINGRIKPSAVTGRIPASPANPEPRSIRNSTVSA